MKTKKKIKVRAADLQLGDVVLFPSLEGKKMFMVCRVVQQKGEYMGPFIEAYGTDVNVIRDMTFNQKSSMSYATDDSMIELQDAGEYLFELYKNVSKVLFNYEAGAVFVEKDSVKLYGMDIDMDIINKISELHKGLYFKGEN